MDKFTISNIDLIRESEEKYRSLFNTMDQGFCIVELLFDNEFNPLDYRFLEVNPVFENQTGLRDVVGKTARQLVPDLESRWFQIYGKVATTGETIRFIEGSEAMGRWFNVNAFRIGDDDSRKVAILFTDITEQKKSELALKASENALRKSEEHLRALISATSDIIYTMNADWSEMGVLQGKVFVPDIGKPRRDWFNNIPKSDQELVRHTIDEAIRTKSVFQLEHKIKLANGTVGWTFSRAIPILDHEGTIIEWLGAASDVTERKKTEITLLESQGKLQSIMNNAPLAIGLYVGKDMVIENPNQTFIDILGKGPAIEGLPLREALPELVTENQPLLDILNEVFTIGIPFSTEGTPIKIFRNGEMTNNFYNFSYTPIFDEGGNTYAIVAIARDVTEHIIANQYLQESEKRLEAKNIELTRINNDLDNFIYTASHDLRAPVSNIEGLVDSLRNNLRPEMMDDETELILQLIDKSISRFKNTIQDLTEITKIQKGLEAVTDDINLEQIIQDVILGINDTIVAAEAAITIDIASAPTLKFSRKNLNSILYNLVSNGIKYRDPSRRPEINIKTQHDDGMIILTVQDNGLGISKENQAKMFTMFKRFHDHVEGTGIGLYIVKRIVDNAGGSIEVESEVGHGTTFKIYFKNS